MAAIAEGSDGDAAIAAYKRLLKDCLDRRPSGTRQRLAAALGTHKSFISQITNPNYRVPLPAQHVPAILQICHFSPEERDAFIAAYEKAHPGQAPSSTPESQPLGLTVTIEVPHFGDPARQAEVAEAIRDVAARIIALAKKER